MTTINFGRQTVKRRDGGETYVSGKRWRRLRVLWAGRGTIVKHQTIRSLVWAGHPPASPNSIRELVRRLRLDLEGSNLEIRTANLTGYRLEETAAPAADIIRLFTGYAD